MNSYELQIKLEAQAREIAQLRAAREADEKKEAERLAKERKTKLTTGLDAALGKHLPTERVKEVRMFLTHPDINRVSFDEDSDAPVFVDEHGLPTPLETGLRTWLKSDEGRRVAPGRSAPTASPSSVDDFLESAFMAHARGQLEEPTQAHILQAYPEITGR